jgi:NADH-quinone oxidoreductase subunit J
VLHNAFGARKLPSTTAPIYRTSDIGLSIFSTYLIPFEVVSVLLLAALVGAVVIARRD